METFSALLAICEGNPPVTGEFPSQKSVTRSFDVFFNVCLNKRLRKQSRRWWLGTPSYSLCRHKTSPILHRPVSVKREKIFFSTCLVISNTRDSKWCWNTYSSNCSLSACLHINVTVNTVKHSFRMLARTITSLQTVLSPWHGELFFTMFTHRTAGVRTLSGLL